MANRNEMRVRALYDALSNKDLSSAGAHLTDDVVWSIPGRSSLAGEYRGRDAVLDLFSRLADETAGTHEYFVHDVLANDGPYPLTVNKGHSVAIVYTAAERNGKSFEDFGLQLFHLDLTDGRVLETWYWPSDAYLFDEFWS